MFHRYQYESETYPSLSRIPLHVRMKLDVTGIKISLKDWLAFSIEERTVLCHLPVEAEEEKQAFASYLDFLSRRYRGEPVATTVAMSSSLWDSALQVPGRWLEKRAADPFGDGRRVAALEILSTLCFVQDGAFAKRPEQFFAVLKEFRELKD